MSRSRRKARVVHLDDFERGPTPETLAQLERAKNRFSAQRLLERLLAEGLIDDGHVKAAQRIQQGCYHLNRAQRVKAASLWMDRVDGDSPDWYDAASFDLVQVYLRWHERAGSEATLHDRSGRKLSLSNIATTVLVDEVPLRHLECRWGLKNGSLKYFFIEGIQLFADVYAEMRKKVVDNRGQ